MRPKPPLFCEGRLEVRSSTDRKPRFLDTWCINSRRRRAPHLDQPTQVQVGERFGGVVGSHSGKVQTDASQLIAIASMSYGRKMRVSEIVALSSGKAYWALRRLPKEILSEAAQQLALSNPLLSASAWLEAASEMSIRRDAAVRASTGRRTRAQGPNSSTFSLCTGCGNVLPVAAVCGCPAVENSGRPGS